MKSNGSISRNFYFLLIIIWVALVVICTFFVRDIRSLFPLPIIDETKSVGYAQYFGYPIYFDTLAFNFFFLSPLVLMFFAKLYLYFNSKKNV